jgi:hypothetical protein
MSKWLKSEVSIEFHLGFGQGLNVDWGRWENQHGKGIYFNVLAWFFCFEFRTDIPA